MLHTKFQGHQSIGSGEEDFFKNFTIYGHGGHVGHVTQIIYVKILFPFSLKLSYEPWFQITQLFLRKTSFNFEILVTFDQSKKDLDL